jgi:hypothetical protein
MARDVEETPLSSNMSLHYPSLLTFKYEDDMSPFPLRLFQHCLHVRIWGASERRTTGTGSQNPELPLAHIMMVLVLRQVPLQQITSSCFSRGPCVVAGPNSTVV